jgi:hypothetical protein
VLGVVLGSVLVALGAICRFNTAALLAKSPAKEKPASYDEARTVRFLRRAGVVFMALGVALVILAASKN